MDQEIKLFEIYVRETVYGILYRQGGVSSLDGPAYSNQ